MQEQNLTHSFRTYSTNELSATDRELVMAACEASKQSYAPYSKFHVGAAARLADGTIVSGNNQENAAYPSGLCAERITLFYANARYPEQPVETLAIAARDEHGQQTRQPISPCGACRQVMLETSRRFRTPMRVLLCGENKVYEIPDIDSLLPFSFDASALNER